MLKKLVERSRVHHSHKLQPTLDTKSVSDSVLANCNTNERPEQHIFQNNDEILPWFGNLKQSVEGFRLTWTTRAIIVLACGRALKHEATWAQNSVVSNILTTQCLIHCVEKQMVCLIQCRELMNVRCDILPSGSIHRS